MIVKPLQELTGTQSTQLHQLQNVVTAISALYAQMDARMTALERERTAATILHKDALRLARLIRERSDDECARYGLGSAGRKVLIHELKRAVLNRYGVKDMHDVPQLRLQDAEKYIAAWPSFRAVIKARAQEEAHGET